MNKHVAAGLMVAGLIGAAVFAGPKLVEAQQRQQTPYHVIVLNDVMHVISPPLRGTTPIPPAFGARQRIPLLHPMPLQSRVQAPAADPVLQSATGPLASTTSGQNFLGVGVGLGNYSDCCIPPDTNGAVGATQYVQWVNSSLAIFDKSTGKVVSGPMAGNTLWSSMGGACANYNSGDPVAEYDKQAGRWVLMQPVFTSPYYICVAVSQTSDATGAYNLYQFSIPSNYFPDYPKLSVWPDGYYLSYNAFLSSTGPFQGGFACAMDRTSMLSGKAATMQCFNSGYPSLLPSDLDGASGAPGTTAAPPSGSPDYFIDMSGGALYLWQFHVDFANPNNSSFTGPAQVSNVAAFSEACNGGTCIPEPSGYKSLDSLADRLMFRLAYRNFGDHESLVVSHAVDTGNGNAGVRWYEIRSPGSKPTVYQQGTFAPDASSRWMSSIAQDEKGDMAVGYSVSSSTLYPSIAYTGRLASDALGTMESESSILKGTGGQTSYSRWGDYSAMSIDPVDDCTFWYTNEFHASSGSFNWSTQIASFSFSGCAAPPAPDFSIAATPSSQTVTQGTGTSYTISGTESNGYTGNPGLSVSGLPSGATATFTPTSLDFNASSTPSSTLSVTTAGTTPAGSYPLTITANDGTLSHTAQVTLVVVAPDFSISGTPSSQTVTAGVSTSYTVNGTESNGYTGNPALSVSGLPSGATATFTPTSLDFSASSTPSSTMSVTTTAGTTPAGSYSLTITADDGTVSHTTQVTLVVNVPDFSLSGSPSSRTVTQGGNTSYTISGTASNGYTGNPGLSATGLPSGASASFSPTSLNFSSSTTASSTMSVTTASNTPAGTYTITVTGSDGTLTHTTTVSLTVQNPAADFGIAATPSTLTVAPNNGSGSYNVVISALNGFNGTVNFSVTGVPGHVSASFSPTSVTGSGSTTLTITAHHKSGTGTFPLQITGTSGSLTHSVNVTLVIGTSTTPDFSISGSPSLETVAPGGSTTYTISLTPSNSYSGSVTLSAAGLPSGAGATFSPNPVSVSGTSTASSTMTVTTSSSTPAGNSTLTVTGTDANGLSHSTTVTLSVQTPTSGDFSIAITPTSQTVSLKSKATYTVTVTGSGGFNGTVSFSVSGLPSHTNASFNPSTVTGSGSTTLTINTTPKSATGTFGLTITGTSGSLVHSATASLTIQ